MPERWTSPQGLVTVSIRDHVKRWFVAISAATGYIVDDVLDLHGFWNALYDKVHDNREIVLSTILVGISIIHTGSIQSYVFKVSQKAVYLSAHSTTISYLTANRLHYRHT